MNEAVLGKYLASCESLPALPLALQNVKRLMLDPKSSMTQIAEVIATDPALASKTIKLVNSAFYGMSRPISSITQAIIILGLNAVNHLMLGLSVLKMFGSGKNVFDHSAFWRHAFGVASIAKGIAQAIGHDQPEECFIAGLLHDIGRLVLEYGFHDDYITAINLARRKEIALLEAETSVFGADHAFVGGHIAQTWKIPPVFVAAIAFHHNPHQIPPEFGEYAPVVRIVAAANAVAGNGKIGDSGEHFFSSMESVLPLEITLDTIQKIILQTKATIASTLKQWEV